MVYKADIIKEYGLSFGDAGAVMGGINRQAILDTQRQKYRWELWDEASPVNGVQPETIKQRPDYPKHRDSVAFFIYKGNTLLYFQYTNPEGGGHMTAQDAERIANEQVMRLAEQDTDTEVWERIKQNMENL